LGRIPGPLQYRRLSLRAGILALLGVVVAGRDSKSLHLSLNEMVRNIRAKDTTVTIVKALQWLKKKKRKNGYPGSLYHLHG